MKLIFVENRYTTWLWRDVSSRLRLDGHEIHWIVQNPVFAMPNGTNHILPFPRKNEHPSALDLDVDLLNSDRAVRFFGRKNWHYLHYAHAISAVLDQVQPDAIFGEPTQFHELITIALARKLEIPYLFPSSTRYPPGRLIFHVYGSMETFGGCGIPLAEPDAAALRAAIVERRAMPSYMSVTPVSFIKRILRTSLDRSRVIRGWMAGEVFATPSPWRKLMLDRQHAVNVARWESKALPALPVSLCNKPWVLYAMQMQPESNLDVWGHPWSNQVEVIRAAADALLHAGAFLVVKPNPKSKYELSASLCDLVEAHPGIVAMAHDSRMVDVFPQATAVLSVTGTVLIEALLSCKPVGTLGSHAMARYPGITQLGHPADISALVNAACTGAARTATPSEGCRLLSDIHARSYNATLYDPLIQPEMGSDDNLERIADAFRHVLRLLIQPSANSNSSLQPTEIDERPLLPLR